MTGLTPFTAEQIRSASPEGRRYVFRVDAAGADPHWTRTTFVAVDGEGALLRMERWDLQRAPTVIGEVRQTWEELQAHATYPADRTVVTEGAHDTPVGRVRTRSYVTSATEDHPGGTAIFAAERPGPPVLVEIVRDGAILRRLTLEADDGGSFGS